MEEEEKFHLTSETLQGLVATIEPLQEFLFLRGLVTPQELSGVYTEIAAKFLLKNREEAALIPEMLAKRIAKFDPARILMRTPPKGAAE